MTDQSLFVACLSQPASFKAVNDALETGLLERGALSEALACLPTTCLHDVTETASQMDPSGSTIRGRGEFVSRVMYTRH